MKNKENIITELKEKIGEKNFSRLEIAAEEKFGQKESLKFKYYQNILDGSLDINTIFTSDEVIESIKLKLESFKSEDEKNKYLLEILDTYDVSDPSIRSFLKKYERAFKLMQKNNFYA